jgi:hypothetical protein
MNEQVSVIEHRLGQDATISVTCRDASGVPVDVSTATIALGIHDYPGADARSVTLVGTPTKTASGVVTQAIADTELTELTPGDYGLTVSATISGVKTIYPVHGQWILRLLA